MEEENTLGQMEDSIKESMWMMKNTGLANTGGLGKFLKEIGKEVFSMEKDFIPL